MNTTHLSLGSNLGNREKHLKDALLLLSRYVGEVFKVSPVYETEPWGYTDDKSYLNQVAVVETDLGAREILKQINIIEREMGRVRGIERYSARTIDIDILFFNEQVVDFPDLKIPHPEIANRLFVLTPLADIAPDFIHPVLKVSVKQLLECCPDNGKIFRHIPKSGK
jgi:2-amino-4-hydroxy-6-hydroxymethyldihydropteridine diphosphokinase